MSNTKQFHLGQMIYYEQGGEVKSGKFLNYGEGDVPRRPGEVRIYGGPQGEQSYIFATSVLKEYPCADCEAIVPLNPYYTHWSGELPICPKCWLKRPFIRTYEDLRLSCLDPEFHERTCDYWYTVTWKAMAHTAFHSAEELMLWLSERGLWLTDALPLERGTPKGMRIGGCYRVASYLDVGVFQAIQPSENRFFLKTAKMDNARWTLAKITQDKDGVRTVHHLNCNVKERIEFPQDVIGGRKPGYQLLIQSSPDLDPGKIVKMKQCPWCERDMPEKGFAPLSSGNGIDEIVCAECREILAGIEANEK